MSTPTPHPVPHPVQQTVSGPRAGTTHPLILLAATAVTAASLTAIAALLGWLPGNRETPAEPPPLAASAPIPAAPAAPPQTPPVIAPPAPAAPAAAAPAEARPPRRVAAQPARAPAAAPAPATVAAPPEPPRNDSGIAVETRPSPPPCPECATIESIREVRSEGQGSGLGAVAGGVLGGLVGKQFGKGGGNKALTVAGALGGAYAGHEAEKNMRASTRYRVIVRFDDGGTQTLTLDAPPQWRGGDRVRVVDGRLLPL